MSVVRSSHPKATVIESRPGEVKVRLGDGAVMPRWYPSVLSDTPVDAEGYMLRTNKEQMLFIPEGYDEIDAYTKAEVDALITASGSFPGFGGTGVADLAARSDHDHTGVYAPNIHSHAYADITDKPVTFTPSPHTHGVSELTATGTKDATTFLRGDNTFAVPPDTKYSAMTTAEAEAGTSGTARVIAPLRLKEGVLAHAPVKAADIANFETTTQLNARDTANRNRANHTGTQTAATISNFNTAADARITAQKGVASGIATLDSGGKIPTSQIPALALTDVYVVASQAAQLALAAQEGDVAIRSDESKSYIHNGGSAGTMADWSLLASPADAVLSVNSKTGAVTLTTTDIAEGTNLYYPSADKTKLAGIAAGATANQTNAYLLSRANHTGNQAISTITNLQEILDGKPLVVDNPNRSTAIGVDSMASGASSFAAGDTAVASNTDAIAVGTDASATGISSTAMGTRAQASQANGLAVGTDAVSGTDATAVGVNAQAMGTSSLAVGQGAMATAAESVAVGQAAVASGQYATATGKGAEATDAGAVAIGWSALSSGLYSSSIGLNSTASGITSIAIGAMSIANGDTSTAIGAESYASGINSYAIGSGAWSSGLRSTALGFNATVAPGESHVAEIGGVNLRVLRRDATTRNALAFASTLQLADDTGTLHVLGMDAALGLTYDAKQVVMPPPARGAQNLNQNRTSAATDIDFSTTYTVAPSITGSATGGLKPSTNYYVTIDVFISGSASGTSSFRPILKFPTGGADVLSGLVFPMATAVTPYYYKWSGVLTSNGAGVIAAYPAMRWVSGNITSSRAEIILTVTQQA